jgi:hypothetical protein
MSTFPKFFFDTKLPEANTNPATRTDDSTVMQEENTLFSVIGFDLISSGTFRTYVVGTFDFKSHRCINTCTCVNAE